MSSSSSPSSSPSSSSSSSRPASPPPTTIPLSANTAVLAVVPSSPSPSSSLPSSSSSSLSPPSPPPSLPSLPPSSSRINPTLAAAEYRVATKWDQCIENTLVKSGMGIVACGLASLLLFKSPAARSGLTMFGGGFGAGQSWLECRQYFAHTKTYQPTMVKLQMPDIIEEKLKQVNSKQSK